MVHLSLAPAKGPLAGKSFPFQGFLGLTPLRVEGVATARRDNQGVQAKSFTVAVRCYESRQGKTGVIHSRLLVDYPQTIWRCPPGQDYADFGDFQSPFKITLPKRVPGFSTANYQEYRTFWRLEAVIDHVPLSGVGSRTLKYYSLPLVRYDVPAPLPSPPPPSPPSTPHVIHTKSSPATPVFSYNVSTPATPIGPSDYIFTFIHLRPLTPHLIVRSASVLVERRLALPNLSSAPNSTLNLHVESLDDPDSPKLYSPSSRPSTASSSSPSSLPPPPSAPIPIAISTSMPESSSNATRRSPYAYSPPQSTSTIDTITPPTSIHSSTAPLIPSQSTPPNSSFSSESSPPKVHCTTITYADAGRSAFAVDSSTGVMTKTVSLQWPKSRSQNVWSMGETFKSEIAEVTFWVKVKVIISSPLTGTDTFDLEAQEVTVVSTNDADRRVALAQFAARKEVADRSKSKSPRRKRTPRKDEPENSSSSDTPLDSTPILHAYPWASPPVVPIRPSSSQQRSHPPLPSPVVASPTFVKVPSPHFSHSQSSTSSFFKTSSQPSKHRRPHTSAGPRDKSNLLYADSGRHPHSHTQTLPTDNRRILMPRPSTKSGVAPEYGMSYPVDVEQLSRGQLDGTKDDPVRAWEEELARIEHVSKRSSIDMLGGFFKFGKKKRQNAKDNSVRVE